MTPPFFRSKIMNLLVFLILSRKSVSGPDTMGFVWGGVGRALMLRSNSHGPLFVAMVATTAWTSLHTRGDIHFLHKPAPAVPTVWLTCWTVVSPGSPWDMPPFVVYRVFYLYELCFASKMLNCVHTIDFVETLCAFSRSTHAKLHRL